MMLLLSMMTISMLMIWLKHPLTMGLMLLIQTINMTMYIGYLHYNYWFSYILFLIMIGGMLVLFIYMTSVASNEKFHPSIKLFIFTLLMSMLWFPFFLLDSFYFDINNFYNNFQFNNELNLSLTKYLNFPNYFMMYLLITYLLITLLVIVEITNFKKKGTLRSMK
uniref:NADH-ubiquinone oxidoreductase chain 6 n=1 Tax=Onthophagus laticollis TaxID=1848545 RepID=A0A1X9HD77_9SCAR|nr:NADH deshydrogenase subunit 6 [Onthophagus laticollis]